MNAPLADSFARLIDRDLLKLREEILLYQDNESLWTLRGNIANTGGNLALHLCGNLRHFIGAVLGKDGYLRNRDAEFATRGLSKEAIVEEIERCRESVGRVLSTLSNEALDSKYPLEVFGAPMTTHYFLSHLAVHLGYHLGQVNYHRRIITAHTD